ncbi:GNAT family N-acetyltransferase [Cellulomonas sp. ICMP 17802]|uniref:GNAT family N-acetyltransferase n=1 Tax=Cellulomonas sp. ICMP 17802 TaxID=3239199 RepID=UPI00351B0664
MITVHGTGAAERIRTDRLTVRRFDAGDGEALHRYLSQPEAVRFEPYDVQTRLRCHELALDRAGDEAFWAVCRTEDELLIGNLYLHRDDPRSWHTYTLGYVFDPAQWGHGYATEAARALLDVCFRDWGAQRVAARCNPENARSWRLLERLGMRREGLLEQAASFATDAAGRPLWHDAYLYAVLEDEWSAERQS